MKRAILLILVFLVPYTLYSKDTNGEIDAVYKKYSGFSIEGGASFLSGMSGGFLGFGFSIYHRKNFFVRNNVRVLGAGMDGSGFFGIREQIQIGGISLLYGYFYPFTS